MGKYLKLFETTAAYNAAKDNLILPNVSLITETNGVEYNPDIYNGHDYVEIGGIKWATMNIGANSVTDYGLYFQWGDTQGYAASEVGTDKVFNWVNYKYSKNGGSKASDMTKYNSTDGLTALTSADDAVTIAWGGSWRMPTMAEFSALGTATTSAWTADYEGSGVAGLVCTDKNDSTKVLFFPATGYGLDGSVINVGIDGSYWSSSLNTSVKENGWCLYFRSSERSISSHGRQFGNTVRGVVDE